MIAGGGLAGLACAKALNGTGAQVTLLEGSERVGGRVASDEVEGFIIDRGFQVLLAAYPEIDRQLDRGALDLRPFERGALVRRGRKAIPITDPFANPLKVPRMAVGGLLRPRDAVATLKLLREARSGGGQDRTILAALESAGVSGAMLEGFWRPFLAGITLDRGLQSSSRFLDFLLVNFSAGPATLPNGGMRRIPEQLAAALPEAVVRTNSKVKAIEKGRVILEGGEVLEADHVVIATDGRAAAKLVEEISAPATLAVGQIAFDAGSSPPTADPVLVLDGDGDGPVNNVQVISNAAPGYAPAGRSLVTCSILEHELDQDDELLERRVRLQLGDWFGPSVNGWRTLRIDRVEHSLPAQPVGSLDPIERPLRLRRWLWVAGDHRSTASIDGALSTGRHVGEQIASTIAEQA